MSRLLVNLRPELPEPSYQPRLEDFCGAACGPLHRCVCTIVIPQRCFWCQDHALRLSSWTWLHLQSRYWLKLWVSATYSDGELNQVPGEQVCFGNVMGVGLERAKGTAQIAVSCAVQTTVDLPLEYQAGASWQHEEYEFCMYLNPLGLAVSLRSGRRMRIAFMDTLLWHFAFPFALSSFSGHLAHPESSPAHQ